MDFQNIHRLNIRLNLLSGNLLPMIGDGSPFPAVWKIHSAIIWVFSVMQITAILLGIIHVPKDKVWRDAMVPLQVITEVFLLLGQMNLNRDLVNRLTRKLNDTLRVRDEAMESIVRSILTPVEKPLQFYWMAGIGSVIVWSCFPLAVIMTKKQFFYEDYRVPAMYSKQPFSTNIFVLGSLIAFIAHLFIFLRKVSLNVYMINLVLLLTAQYRYISTKLSTIFRERIQQNEQNEHNGSHNGKRNFNLDLSAEIELKALCRHHSTVI